MTRFPTCLKYWVLCFDNRIEDKIERKAVAVVFADSEDDALTKASRVINRKFYEVYEVSEIIDQVN